MTMQQLESRAFPQGGFYVMRHGDLYMLIGCVPADPKALSGHKHSPRLSFELFAGDKSFIIDPGAYIYTADKEMRNLFRSTKYHNTVVVDDEEHNRFDEDELFAMNLDAAVNVNGWLVTENYDLLDAEHNGYSRLIVVHRRQIETGNKTGANIAIAPLETDGLKLAIENGWVSYNYGKKVEAPIVKYSNTAEVPTEFVTVIAPGYMPSVEEIGRDMKRCLNGCYENEKQII